ncbi:MAG: hypothetical protein P4L33_22335 [Capsulimonadaceae bacterium]|jgi:photosystem II stability/assembly factor-like uncharacterized protein|nr:hypothetical protein [Capsulimonadaceae bacterium]
MQTQRAVSQSNFAAAAVAALALVFLLFCIQLAGSLRANAATIEEAWTSNHGHLWALKLEGETVPAHGDDPREAGKLAF